MFVFRNSRVFFSRRWFVSFVCFEKLHVGRWHSQKKKWTKDEISSLTAWNYETNAICGPRIDLKKAGSTVSRTKHKAVHNVSSDYSYTNASQVDIRVKPTDSETLMADYPCSVSVHLSSQTVLEHPVEELRSSAVSSSLNSQKTVPTEKRQMEVSNSSSLSKQSSENSLFDSTKRKGTYGYTWVNSFSPPPPTKTVVRDENAVASFAQTAQNIGTDNVAQNAEDVSHHTSSMMNSSSDTDRMSDSDREQSVINSSATKLQTEEDEAQTTSSDQYILSFPLFTHSELLAEAVNLTARLPSVSAILKATMSPESQMALIRWEQRMIAELGEDGFKQYQKGW